MAQASIPAPSVRLMSFACPHCGAHATQHWYFTLLQPIKGENPVPSIYSADELEDFAKKVRADHDAKSRAPIEKMLEHYWQLRQGAPFIGETTETYYGVPNLENLFVSRCYTCRALALWLHDRLLYPATMVGPAPNGDLSPDVLRDYEEARSILDLSHRGAAALLRLAVEKICIELGAEGKNINERIAYLVAQGLPLLVQKALDAVRVIGNEAVHPGQIDLRDDRDTALKLFGLVNFIAEDRVTRPKQIAGLYETIPPEKREAIDLRNAKALDKAK